MNTYTRFLLVALLLALAVSASAAQIFIPRDTVIPVTLDNTLSSATSRVGNAFYVHQAGSNGQGFPDNTKFTGNVDSVTRASGNTAGQIGVSFLSAKMPDGTRVPIVGQLTSWDDRNANTNSSNGRLTAPSNTSKTNLKFTAMGAGAGLVLGQVIGKKPFIGTLLGGAAGYLYGSRQARPSLGRDVTVPAGTRFGILLTEDVSMSQFSHTPNASNWSTVSNTSRPHYSRSSTSTGAGAQGPGWQVTFSNLQPVMTGNDLMLPFRSVMDSIGMPFDYDSSSKQISVNDYETETLHTVGTRVMNVNGRNTTMSASSRIMDGAIYVPASYIEMLTNRTAYWNQSSGVLRIE